MAFLLDLYSENKKVILLITLSDTAESFSFFLGAVKITANPFSPTTRKKAGKNARTFNNDYNNSKMRHFLGWHFTMQIVYCESTVCATLKAFPTTMQIVYCESTVCATLKAFPTTM